MKNLYIISAGAFGRELESWLEQSPEFGKEWRIAGFLHSGEDILKDCPSDYKIVGDWTNFNFSDNDMVIPGIADPAWKHRIFSELHSKVRFMTYIHPSAVVGKFTTFEDGCVVCPHCLVSTNVHLGPCVILNCGTQVGHDVIIGEFSSLMANVDLGGWVHVGKSVFMGTQSMVVPKKRIGDNVKISAGALVIRNVKDGESMFGAPARNMNFN